MVTDLEYVHHEMTCPVLCYWIKLYEKVLQILSTIKVFEWYHERLILYGIIVSIHVVLLVLARY